MRYPPDLPTAARDRIERALTDADLAVSEAGPPQPLYQMFILGGPPPPPTPPRPAAWDPAYVVLTVLEVGVREYVDTARTRRWTVDKLRTHTEDLRDQLLERSRVLDPVVFDQRLRACSWWLTFQRTLRDWRMTPPSAAPTFPNRAAWLQAHLDKRRETAHAFATRSGTINHRTIKQVLKGVPVQDAVLDRLAQFLGCHVRDVPMT